MRRAALILSLLLTPTATALSTGTVIEFDAPAPYWGNVSLADAAWILVVLGPSDEAQAVLSTHDDSRLTNTTYLRHLVQAQAGPEDVTHSSGQNISYSRDRWTGRNAELRSTEGRWSSLFITAENLTATAHAEHGVMAAGDAHEGLEAFRPSDVPLWTHRRDLALPEAQPVLATGSSRGLQFNASGSLYVEWQEWDTSCPGPCLDGAHVTSTGHGMSLAQAHQELRPYVAVSSPRAEFRFDGHVHAWAGGAREFDAAVQRIRLPLATTPGACSGCLALENETLLVEGDLQLEGVRLNGSRLHAELRGDGLGLRVDETMHVPGADPGAIVVAGAGVAAVVLLWLWKFKAIVGGFVRVTQANVLRHEARGRIYEAVKASPGSTAHDVARRSGFSRTNTVHHLEVLRRFRLIKQTNGGGRRVFFAKEDCKDRDAPALAALQDHNLCLLRAMLEQRAVRRIALLRYANAEHGWPPTTTEYRLKKLEDCGLVRKHRIGGCVWYVDSGPTSHQSS